jgi:hypothetical protein
MMVVNYVLRLRSLNRLLLQVAFKLLEMQWIFIWKQPRQFKDQQSGAKMRVSIPKVFVEVRMRRCILKLSMCNLN